jgi:hypothetical protein
MAQKDETVHAGQGEGFRVRSGRPYKVVVERRCPCCDHQEIVQARNRNLSQERPRAKPDVVDLKTGLLKSETKPSFPLPFNLSEAEMKEKLRIGAGFSDYQRYGAQGHAYVHGGIDFRAPKWTAVHAVTGGEIEVFIRSVQHSSVTVYELDAAGEPIGRRWEYAHLDPDALKRHQNGEKVRAGQFLGIVAEWFKDVAGMPDQIDVCDGKLYSHLHLNMVVTDAQGVDHYYDSLRYMTFPDAIRPTIVRIHLVQDGGTKAFSGKTPVVSGNVDVAIEAYDRTSGWERSEGRLKEMKEGAPFKLGVYRAELVIAPVSGSGPRFEAKLPAFDQMVNSGGGYGQALSRAVYLDELEEPGSEKKVAQGDRFKRESFLVVTNAVKGQPDAAGCWDTSKFPDGEYRLTVKVFDRKGNSAERSRTVAVKNGS